ncbi:MAG: DUF669 domain-containing protein [Planctomycetes bacterium]|nr:DUF669 domain-containing protein [Planctomycetota bacterium]
MAQLHFNAEEVEPANFDPLPEGKYQAVVSASEMKPTKKHNGAYLELEIVVIDGPYINRKVWTRFNMDNPNADAVRIAKQQLSGLCRAVGMMHINDSSQLHNRPFIAYIVCKPRGDGNGLQNEVKSYEAVPQAVGGGLSAVGTATTPAAEAVPTAQSPQPKAGGPGPAPWGRPATP